MHYAGAGTTAYRMYRRDAGRRFRVSLVYGNPQQQSADVFEAIHHIPPFPTGMRSVLSFLARSRSWLRRHAREYDIFHGLTGFQCTVAPAVTAKSLGLPAVIKIANAHSDLADKGGLKALLALPRRRRQAVLKLDAVIATSRQIVQELRGYGLPEEKIAHIPNGVDDVLFHPADDTQRAAARQELQLPDRPTMLFCGEIGSRKRPHLLIEALADVEQAQLVLVGPVREPDYAQTLHDRVSRLGLEQRVFLRGHTEQIERYYQAADLFALPSANEGMPNAALEALACALPCVFTDFSSAEELTDDGRCGRIVAPQAAAVAEAIRDYLSDESALRAAGQAGRALIQRRFSVEVVLDQHQALFRRLITGSAPAAAV